MRTALVNQQTGRVENIILAGADYVARTGYDAIPVGAGVCMGWLYADGVFAPPPPDVEAMAAEVKALAYAKIVAIMPEYVQRNRLALQSELTLKQVKGEPLTEADLAAEAENQALWNRAKAIRAASDLIEADIRALAAAGDVAALAAYDIASSSLWSE